MSVITAKKRPEELLHLLGTKPELPLAIIGCDKCAKLSKTGGSEQVAEVKAWLKTQGLQLLEPAGLPLAVEEGLCDPKAAPERLAPLKGKKPFRLLVLACGAGLLGARQCLPQAWIIPGLNTLGPGVKDQLACLACGDCRFGEQGCKMLAVVEEQRRRLSLSYQAR